MQFSLVVSFSLHVLLLFALMFSFVLVFFSLAEPLPLSCALYMHVLTWEVGMYTLGDNLEAKNRE